MKNLELKPSDILTVDGEVMQIDTITSQLASIEDVGGQYKGSIQSTKKDQCIFQKNAAKL